MLSENIKNLQKAKGLSQEELAVKLNVVGQTVSKWEKGKAMPKSVTPVSISQYFNVSLDYLMKEDNSVSDEITSKENSQTKSGSGREKRNFGVVLLLKSLSDK